MAEEPGPANPERRGGITRRQALIGGGAVVVVGGGAAAIVLATGGGEEEGENYPKKRIASVSELRPGKPVSFEYPLKGQQSVLLDMGEEVPGGVGDKNSIVAYSALCQHMGCPVGYVADKRHFLCTCHQSQYDPAREGYVIQGVAQRPLPRIALEVDGDDINAVGVDGLIYGYRTNLSADQSAA